jgi:hypothetical protein
MITVRYPTGFSVQYNSGDWVHWMDGLARISTASPEKGGLWIADVQASAGAIIEVRGPCRTYNANLIDAAQVGEIALEKIRSVDGATLRKMKDALRNFDARRGTWTR